MQFRMKALVAAVALAASGSAMAAIAPSSSGNGELYLAVWDQAGNRSLTFDLGVNLSDFLPGGPVTSNSGYTTSFTLAGNSVWDSFVSGLTTSQIAGFKWDVTAGDSTTAGGIRYLSTSTSTRLAIAGSQFTSQLKQFSGVDNYINAVNALLPPPGNTDFNVDAVQSVDNPLSPAYYNAGTRGEKWANKATFTTDTNIRNAAPGSALNRLSFFLLTPGASDLAKANVTQYGNVYGTAYWTFSEAGVLTYTLVPEPGTWAMFVAGILTVGAIARRKLSA